MWTLGQIDELRELYEQERVHLLALARGLAGRADAAEDAVHCAFEGVLRLRQPPRELRPYVYRAVRNAALDGHRRRRNHTRLDDAGEPATPGDGDRDVELSAALARLPPKQRIAVVACLVVGFTADEAGRLLGTPAATIATRRRRGLERLRKEFDPP